VGQNSGGSVGGSSGGGGGGGGQQGQGGGGATIARVSVAGGTPTGGRQGGGGQQSQGGVGGGLNFLTKTNNMQDVSRAAISYFETLGVDLDPVRNPGKALFFNDRQGMLVVRATMQDLDIIEAAIEVLNIVPPQVNIKAKFVEIGQTDTKALGFDWYLGNTLMANGAVVGQGGTAPSLMGGATPGNPGALPFPSPGILPASTDQLLTSGLQNGTTPTLFTLTGILTDPQFRVAIRALQQRQGTEVLAQPEVTTTSGRQAQMKATDVQTIITSFSFNQAVGPSTTTTAGTPAPGSVGAAFVYPTPEQMELGPTLDVLPVVLSDGFTVNLTLIPTVMAFDGYDDPTSVLTSAGNLPAGTVLIPTVLPHFTVRQVVSTVNVWDGQTVVLGGLLYEAVQTTKDQIPMLGDLPLIGRLFRSESKSTQKKNLLIFVTPVLIDPAGNRLHSEDEMPFAQTGIPGQPPAAADQGKQASLGQPAADAQEKRQ
jgi:general secretion pathway protein D